MQKLIWTTAAVTVVAIALAVVFLKKASQTRTESGVNHPTPPSSVESPESTVAVDNVVVVDPAVQLQTWEGWETTLAWWANVIGGTPDDVRNDIADRLFDLDGGLGFNIVRYNIGGGENPAYPDHMEYRARIPGYKASESADYEWSADANQRFMLQAAKARIAPEEFIAEAFANSPPWWMTKSGSVTGNHGAAENLREDKYDDFAEYLVTVVKHFRDVWGIDFRTVSPANEPSSN